MEHADFSPLPFRFLLIKSQKYAHTGKYVLVGSRWHRLHEDKPAPKNAPQAAHPKAAGDHKPVSLTPDQIEQLKYPAKKAAANSEMAAFNEKHLPKLLAHGESGDATAILGAGYGTNSHAKKQVLVANYLLEQMGSQHKVSAGQAAGAHVAVQAAPETEPPVAQPAQPEQASVPAEQAPALAMPVFEEGKATSGVVKYYEAVAQKIIDASDAATLQAMVKPEQKSWQGKTGNSKKLMALHAEALSQASTDPAKATAGSAPTKKEPRLILARQKQTPAIQPNQAAAPDPSTLPVATTAASKVDQIPWDNFVLPDTNTNAASANKKLAALKQAAYAGDASAIEAMTWGKNTYNTKLEKLAALALEALKEDGAAQPAEPGGMKQMMAEVAGAGPGAAPAVTAEQKAGIVATKVAGDILSAEQSALWSKLTDDEKSELIVKVATEKTAADMAAESGPKEGDTKQGADGTLVFKNGRWHKIEPAQPQAPQSAVQQNTPVDAKAAAAKVPMPKLQSGTGKLKYTKTMKLLKEIAEQQGAEGLSNAVKITPAGHVKIAGYKTINPQGSVYGKNAEAMAQYAKALHEAVVGANAVGSGASAAPASPTPTPNAASTGGLESMDAWQQTGPQGGSNPGGKFKDANGVEWYCKFPGDDDVAKSEVLAAKLYAALGIAGQDAKLVTKGGKIGIASRWVDVKKASAAELAKTPGVQAGFGADAWLGNWDVVGMANDNLQVGANGKAVRVDAGGSLTYRAQGKKKAFGATVIEIDSLRDASINPQAAAVFGGMTQADITASVAKVLALPDATIKNLVMQHGPGDTANRQALVDLLIARKADLAAKFPKAAKPAKKRLDPNNLPITAAQLPKPHDFMNWNGQGKGLSSQPHLNAANEAVEKEMIGVAQTGNLIKLKGFHFHGIDKATGNATGQLIPIAQHPSKHVVQLHSDLVQILDEVANPPQPLKVFRETDVSTLDELAAALPPKPFGTTVGAVHSNEKLGFWVVLGTAKGAASLKPTKFQDYSQAMVDDGYNKYKQAKPAAKVFINAVQDSGSFNDLFRDGKASYTDHSGYGGQKGKVWDLKELAQAALEHATTQPEGTTIYRYQSMPDEMIKKVLAAPDGSVIQTTGPMCASYSSTGTAGFGKHKVVIRYAKGAKAVDSFGSGRFKGEKEVTTLPNSRFVLLKKQKGANGGLEIELLMLPPDLGI